MRAGPWIVLLGLAAQPARAQTPDSAGGVKVGLGVFLNPAAIISDGGGLDGLFVPVGLGNFTLPVLLGQRVRLEPELGFASLKTAFTPTDSDETFSTSQSLWRYGLSAHVVLFDRGGLRPYAGLRFGWHKFSAAQTGIGTDISVSRRDSYWGLAVGGEYFVSPFFSLGGEVQLTRFSVGDPEQTPPPPFPPGGDADSHVWSTNGLVGLRLYLVGH